MADRKISDLTALTTPAAGDYLPIVDISEPSNASKNKRITIEELLRGAPDGTAAAPSIAFESDPDSGIYRPGADIWAVATNGAERIRIDSAGLKFNGDTAAANALDDYEEGTFTPTVYGLTTAGAGTYSVQTGNYTKIGNRVCFTLSLTWSAHTGTGNMQIAGLPFVPAASENSRACTLLANNIALTADNFAVGVYGNAIAEVLVRQQPTGGGAFAFVAMDTAGAFYVSGTYFV